VDYKPFEIQDNIFARHLGKPRAMFCFFP